MTQLQFDVSDDTAAWVRRKAKEMNLSVSKYVAQLIQQDRKIQKANSENPELEKFEVDEELARQNGWPEGYFDLIGSGKDDPIERPDQWEVPLKEITL